MKSRPNPLSRQRLFDLPSGSGSFVGRLGLVLLLLGSLLLGCQRAAPKLVPPKPPEVAIDLPTRQVVTEFEEFTGRTMAVYTVELRARVSGYLDRVFFQDGALVKTGDPLFEIDPRSYRSAVAGAQATIDQLQARLERLTRQEDRRRRLLDTRAVTDEELEQSTFDRAETKAELEAAQATKQLADLNLSFTQIIAPITGRISRRMVDPGNLVRADDTPLTTIVSTDPIHAYFDMDERTVLRLRRLIQEGKIQSSDKSTVVTEIALSDDPAFILRGAINFMDNQIDAMTGTLRVRAVIANPRELLSPGLFVRIRIPVSEPHAALLVREEALGTDQGQRFVYLVNEKDEIVYRRVTVGMLLEGRRVIETGLELGDRVVCTNLQRVRPGIKVTTKPAADTLSGATPKPNSAAGK